MQLKPFLLLILSIMAPGYSYAYYLTTGTYVPYFNKVQVNNEGGTQKFDLNPYLSIGWQLPLSSLHYFSPELSYSFYLKNAKNTKVDYIALHYTFSYIISNDFLFRYGLTNNWYRLAGKGGSVGLKNGSATTVFPSPNKTVTSYFTTLDVGFEYVLTNRKYSVRFDFQSMGFRKYQTSEFNYIFTGNYYF